MENSGYNESTSHYFIITGTSNIRVALYEFVILGALIIAHAAYNKAILNVPATLLYPAPAVVPVL